MKHLKKTALAIFLLLSAIIILPTGAENFLVRAQLDKAISALSNESNQFSLLYDDVSVKGLYPAKRIVMLRPRVTVKTPNGAVVYAFDDAQLNMQSSQLMHWKLELPNSFSIFQNLKKIASAKFNGTINADVILAGIGSKSTEITFDLPSRMVVSRDDMPQKPAFISFDEKPVLGIKTDALGKPEYVRATVKNMIAQGPVPDDRYVLEEGNFVYQRSLQPSQKTMQDIELVLNKLEVPYYIHPYGAGTLILRANLIGDYNFSDDAAGNALQMLTKAGDIEILEASYNAKDFGLNLKGNIQTVPADMPLGSGQLVVRNVPFVLNEIIENNMLSADRRALLYTALSTMTGDSVSDLKDANIPLEKKSGSELLIGGVTLSSLREAVIKNDVRVIKSAKTTDQSSSPASMKSIPNE